MKTLSKVCQVVALVGAVAALVLFFTNFADVILTDGKDAIKGSILAFGGKAHGVDLNRSMHLFACALLTIISVLFAGLGFKSKGSRVAQLIFSGIAAVWMLVIACEKSVTLYINATNLPLSKGLSKSVSYSKLLGLPTVLWVSIALFVCLAFIIANILLDDYIIARQTKGITILGKVKRFLLDYKSEVKKIVWLGPKAIVKNTIVVIVMCLILGAFIWLIDLGIGELIRLILK